MTAEFDTQSIEATMATMTADPVVNHVPVMTGGVGAREVRHSYTQYLIGRHPPDTAIAPLTPTVGQTRIVDELIYPFTHTIEMPIGLPRAVADYGDSGIRTGDVSNDREVSNTLRRRWLRGVVVFEKVFRESSRSCAQEEQHKEKRTPGGH